MAWDRMRVCETLLGCGRAPVVIPCLRSVETVNAVHLASSFLATMSGSASASARAHSIAQQMTPDENLLDMLVMLAARSGTNAVAGPSLGGSVGQLGAEPPLTSLLPTCACSKMLGVGLLSPHAHTKRTTDGSRLKRPPPLQGGD